MNNAVRIGVPLPKTSGACQFTIMKPPEYVGPILFARGFQEGKCRLSAIVVLPNGQDPPGLEPMVGQAVEPDRLESIVDHFVWRYDFELPGVRGAFYRFNGVRYPVAADLTRDIRIAYLSCNGQEHEDDEWIRNQRDRMWRRLGDEHGQTAFNLIFHGGDQLYADGMLQAHPMLAAWANCDLADKADYQFSPEVRAAAERYLFQRYTDIYSRPEVASLLSQVPSVMMWDDHDIIDGWGSHPASVQESAFGQGLFEVARRMFLLFQMGATCTKRSRSARYRFGSSLTLSLDFPGFAIVAPDLRSERRPDRVMGPEGWSAFSQALKESGSADHRFVMSSVPVLGPRLSWVESLIGVVPKLRQYEDDLRDQWQSRAHRREWQRFLRLMEHATITGRGGLTLLSGEIHLATQAEMPTRSGGVVRQLVSSGIAHPPPPKIYAKVLGWLAAVGEEPLPGRPVRLKPVPGKSQVYTAERNYLVLERKSGFWSASWELEESGRTSSMEI